MLSNNKLLQKQEINSERVNQFEVIWEKTEGTDFEKMLAMLRAYCDLKNWGTHSKSVWSVVEKYVASGYYCKTVKKKDVLLFKIEYLLLQLSEKISFNNIKVEGSLAALFHVIFTHTNINAYDFAQGTDLYLAYEKYKNEIRLASMTTNSWKNLFISAIPYADSDESYSSILGKRKVYCPSLVSAFLKAKFIDYVDSWELIVGTYSYDQVIIYDQHCVIADEDFLPLFRSEKIQGCQDFIQYLYCKKYNLNVKHRYYEYSVNLMRTVSLICEFSKEKNDGVLLLDLIKTMQKKISLQHYLHIVDRGFYFMLIKLIEKRYFFENWNEIEKILLVGNNQINFIDLLCFAIESQSLDVVRYLLEKKENNIDIKFLSTMCVGREFNCDVRKNPIQTLIASLDEQRVTSSAEKTLEILKILISYDPDCVRIKDEKENDIFYYWAQASKLLNDSLKNTRVPRVFFNNNGISLSRTLKEIAAKKKMAADFLEEGLSIVNCAFRRKMAFTFFQGRSDNGEDNNIKLLPKDVLGLICTHTIYSEILKRKENPDELINPVKHI
jgi:hypothetical protein